jgi:hypothetical protein
MTKNKCKTMLHDFDKILRTYCQRTEIQVEILKFTFAFFFSKL